MTGAINTRTRSLCEKYTIGSIPLRSNVLGTPLPYILVCFYGPSPDPREWLRSVAQYFENREVDVGVKQTEHLFYPVNEGKQLFKLR